MPTYISLLRGINVSGHNLIKMAELRAAIEGAGFDEVRSYIQSGNLILRSTLRSSARISEELAALIAADFGMQVPVTTRTVAEWKRVHEGNPYVKQGSADVTKLSVTFLDAKPKAAGVAELQARETGADEFVAAGRELYLHLPGGSARTKLDHNSIERILGVQATTRNWRTVGKLREMADRV